MLDEQQDFIYRFDRDIFPEVISIGNCVNIRNCKATNVDLADGWCVNCWDKSTSAKDNIKETIARREEEKKSKQLLREIQRQRIAKLKRIKANRHRKNCACPTHKNKGFV